MSNLYIYFLFNAFVLFGCVLFILFLGTVITGENMAKVADNSVDAVVMTLVLCSVENIEKIMKEIMRVLVPVSKVFICLSCRDEHATI